MALGLHYLYVLGGLCVLAACAISVFSVVQHLLYFQQPEFQRYICRILLMVPIYAVSSWFSMFFPEQKLWIASFREVYEAFAIYSFTMLLIAYVGGERRLAINLEMKEKIEHPWPFRVFLKGMYPGATFLRLVKVGVLQFVLIRPLTALTILICTGLSVYHEGYFGFNDCYLYVFLLSNVSFTISAETGHVIGRQGVVIGLMEKFKLIPRARHLSNEDVGITIQEFLICLEMLAFAIAHLYSFDYRECLTYDDSTTPLKKDSAVVSRITSVIASQVLTAKDVIEEVKNSWNPVSPTQPTSDFEMDSAPRPNPPAVG